MKYTHYSLNHHRIFFCLKLFSLSAPDLSLFSNCQNLQQQKQGSLSLEDLQRIDYIQLLYHRRIELGKKCYFVYFIYL
jgi:hypothetical protein